MTEKEISENETALDDGEYDEPDLTPEELLDLALDNARTCVEHGGDHWAGAYLRDMTALRAERDSARAAAVALEQELAVKDEALAEIQALHTPVERHGIDPMCSCGAMVQVTDFDGSHIVPQRYPCPTQRILDCLQSRLSSAERQYDEQGSEA